MPVKLSYINALNEEIVLDDDEGTFAHELTGRTGFEMPQIETESVTYGDGSQDIVVSRMKPRTVTCYFWADIHNKTAFERQYRETKQRILQIGSRMGDWGKLKIRQVDGTYLYLNCIYKSGFDAVVRDSNIRLKYSLTFEASDPLFYDTYETQFAIRALDAGGLLMRPVADKSYRTVNGRKISSDRAEYNPDGLYFKSLSDPSYIGTKDDVASKNPDSVYMYTAALNTDNTVYIDCERVFPTIKISGAAANISMYNTLTGKKIEFDPSVTVDNTKYILIETKPLHRKVVMVTKSSKKETNLMSKLTSDSALDFYFDRGNNVIQYQNTTPAVDSQCLFTYRKGWLSCD